MPQDGSQALLLSKWSSYTPKYISMAPICDNIKAVALLFIEGEKNGMKLPPAQSRKKKSVKSEAGICGCSLCHLLLGFAGTRERPRVWARRGRRPRRPSARSAVPSTGSLETWGAPQHFHVAHIYTRSYLLFILTRHSSSRSPPPRDRICWQLWTLVSVFSLTRNTSEAGSVGGDKNPKRHLFLFVVCFRRVL